MAPPQPHKQLLSEDLAVRAIKLLDIGYCAAVYFMLALLAVYAFNAVTGPYDPQQESRKSTARLVWEVVAKIWAIGVLAYLARNLLAAIPWPLEGVLGYQHLRVPEVANTTVFVAFVAVFDSQLQAKTKAIKARLGL
jgi:hypothetical protein